MRKFLTSLAAISLVGSFFIAAPAPVAAADTAYNTVKIFTTDGNALQVADSLHNAGRYQTYLVDPTSEVITRIRISGPNSTDGVYATFGLSLAGSAASFGAEFTDTNDMVDFGDCSLDWTDAGLNDQTATFREGTIDCDAASSQDDVYLDFPITVPTHGPAVLTLNMAGSSFDFKVYFFANEPTGDTIYVGSGSMTTNGTGSCTTPDFSTADAAQGFDDEDAIDAALMSINSNSDTVRLCNGTYTYSNDMRLYDGEDLWNDTLSVEAQTNGSVILDGVTDYRLIYAEDVSLDVTGVKFYRGYSGSNGGAINLDDGNLDLNNAVFEENEAIDGAGVYLTDGSLEIDDSQFVDNDGTGNGGGVYLANGTLDIENSTFENNDVNSAGGAVRFVPNGDAATIRNSTFDSNSSNGDGGQLDVQGNDNAAEDVTITDTDFFGGSGQYGGAASFEDVDDVTITRGTFRGNTAFQYGGAIWTDGNPTYVIGASFVNNEAEAGDGGAIAAYGMLEVSDSTFTNNSSDDVGGAIYSDRQSEISDSFFNLNFAGDEGGAVFADDVTTITDSRFINNSSVSWAGALSAADTATIENTVFRSNHSRLGGAIDSWGDRLYLRSTKFFGNYASRWGGAIAREVNAEAMTVRGDVDNTTIFRANRSRVGGPVALYRGEDRLLAREAAHIWRATGAGVYIVRLVKE